MSFNPMLMTELLADEHRRELEVAADRRRQRVTGLAPRSRSLLARLRHRDAT